MLSPATLGVFLLLGLPLVAIVSWAYVKQLEITSRETDDDRIRDLKQTISSLEQKVQDIEEDRDNLQKRVQNLETIVTSEFWNEMPTPGEERDGADTGIDATHSAAEKRTSSADTEDEPNTQTDRAARLADRLRGSS